MFKNIARTLSNIARSAIQLAAVSHTTPKASVSDTAAYYRSVGGRGKASGAAQLKRASTKANNIRKFN